MNDEQYRARASIALLALAREAIVAADREGPRGDMRLFTSTRPICKQIEAFESQLLEMSRQPAAAMSEFSRITQAPETMGGKPCIRGMRITVSMVVGQIGAGRTIDEVLADYPALEREDVLEALRFAASLA